MTTGGSRRAAVLLSATLLVLGSLGACSKAAAPPHAAPTSTPVPLSGTTIHGSGYRFVTPIGWQDNTAHMKTLQTQIDSAATNADYELREDVDVSVLPTNLRKSSLGPAMIKVLKTLDTEIHQRPDVTLGGLPAVHFTSDRHVPSVRDLVVDSYFVLKDGRLFYVQIFADTRVPVDQSKAHRGSVFRSWVWTGAQGT